MESRFLRTTMILLSLAVLGACSTSPGNSPKTAAVRLYRLPYAAYLHQLGCAGG